MNRPNSQILASGHRPASFLLPGSNCWRVAWATRAAFIIDGCDYFRALREALLQATHAIYMLAWDIHSELELLHEALPDGDRRPTALRAVLNHAARRQRRLHAYVLNWDFPVVFSMDREWMPAYGLDWLTHRRVHFWLDDAHPFGSSHHQKVVVIDDALAFVGGLDPTQARWDTAEHRADDPRRGYGRLPTCRPNHDVQMAIAGPVAGALGTLARERWRRATGTVLAPPPPVGPRWPASVAPDLFAAHVGIARTEPRYRDQPEVRENERLYVDAIAAARHSIYIENQYFTSPIVADALAARLAEMEGPEIVLVLPNNTDGWLSQVTMDLRRVKLFDQLVRADRHRRLRIYYPHVPGQDEASLKVHSKLIVIDDWLARVGSANLNNRSMGLDTECDLAVEARDATSREAIIAFRNRLLAEHLGTSPDTVARAIDARASLVAGIEALRGGERDLRPLPFELTPVVAVAGPPMALIDPERPLAPEVLADSLLVEDERPAVQRRVIGWLGLVVLLAGLWAGWRCTPLSELLDVPALLDHARRLRELPGAPLFAYATLVAAGLLLFPITLLILVSIVTFGAFTGFLVAFGGALTSALLAYGVGMAARRPLHRHIARGRLGLLGRRLRRHGVLAVLLVRIIPVAPFLIVNLTAGASRMRLTDYALGTMLGMAPAIVAITLLIDRIRALIERPTAGSAAAMTAVFAAIALATYLLARWLRRRTGACPVQERL